MGGGIVFLACDTMQIKTLTLKNKLKQNVENLGLTCLDGFAYILDRLLDYFKFDLKNTIALIIESLGDGKHMGEISKFLYENNANFVQIFRDYTTYEQNKNKIIGQFLILPLECLHFLDFKAVIYTSFFENSYGDLLTHKDSIKIFLPHAFTFPTSILPMPKDEFNDILKKYKNLNIDYFIVSSKINYRFSLATGINAKKLIPLGYPSLDLNLKNFLYKKPKKSILIAIRDTRSVPYIAKSIELLLKDGYKVVFRPNTHETELLCNKEISNKFSSNELFTYDTNSCVDLHLISEISCIVSDHSSLAFTIPLTNLRPCILFCPPEVFGENYAIKNINNETFSLFDQRIHILAKNTDELVSAIKKINFKKFLKSIEDYKKNEIYNISISSQKIAQFLTLL